MVDITLRPIDESNFIDCFNLQLGDGQDKFVSHPIRSLAQAYVYRDQCQPFGNSNHVSLTCAPDNKAAYGLYKRLGFNESGRSDEDEVELELYLK